MPIEQSGDAIFDLPWGRDGALTIYVGNTELKSYANIKIEERLNELDTFVLTAYIPDDATRTLVQEGNNIKVFIDNTFVFKGRLEKVKYKSSFTAECKGYGMGVKLLNRKTGRIEHVNTAADSIVDGLVPTDTMSKGTIESAQKVTVRFDHDNRARAVAGVANIVGYDWYVDQEASSDYDTDYVNFVARKGSDTSVKTFDIGNNAKLVDRQKDIEHIANDITLLGRGDGINQLEARVHAASKKRTLTTAQISASDTTTLSLDDASQLGSNGDNVKVRVGTEVMQGTLDTSADELNISSRAVNDAEGSETEAIRHYDGIQVWLQENITTSEGPYKPTKAGSEDGSSIDSFGVREEREQDKTIINISTLEKSADNQLKDRYEDIFRIQVSPTDPRIDGEVALGDTVTVKDVTAMDVNDTFRVVGIDRNWGESGEETVLYCANRPLRLIERLKDIQRNTDAQTAHMQGASNFMIVDDKDNCDSSSSNSDYPLELRFFIPDDVVKLNKAELVFHREAYRGYIQNSAHTHDVTLPDHRHTFDALFPHATIEASVGFESAPPSQASPSLDTHTHEWPSFDNQDIKLPFEIDLEGDNPNSSIVTTLSGGGTTETSSSGGSPSYGLFTPNIESSVDVDIDVDDGSGYTNVTTKTTVSVGHESTVIDLSDHITETGQWYKVRLDPSGRCRLGASLFLKFFIESTI